MEARRQGGGEFQKRLARYRLLGSRGAPAMEDRWGQEGGGLGTGSRQQAAGGCSQQWELGTKRRFGWGWRIQS